MENYYEKKLGIQTAMTEEPCLHLEENHRYEPTSYNVLTLLAEHLTLNATERFVDFGSGKGRVPIFIADLFHVPTVGVEYDGLLVEVANMNRHLYTKKHAEADIVFYQCLAQRYKIQKEDTTFFFFNPFSESIFKQVLENIDHTLKKYPRRVTCIVYYPMISYLQLLETFQYECVTEILMPPTFITSPNDRLYIFQK